MDAFAVTHTLEGETTWDSIWPTWDDANEHVLDAITALQDEELEVGEFHVIEMVRKT